MRVVILTNLTSKRLHYAARFVIEELADLRVAIQSTDYIPSENEYTIEYNIQSSNPGHYFVPSWPLINEGVMEYEQLDEWQPRDQKIDLFSFVFFHLSRLEEYSSKETDEHGRFPFTASWSFTKNVLHLPIVDQAIGEFYKRFNYHYQKDILQFRKTFRPLVTFDIDHIYAYKGKSTFRYLGAGLRELFKGNVNDFFMRLKYLANRKDPFDTHGYLLDNVKKRGLQSLAFFLCANYGFPDNNIDTGTHYFKEIVGFWKRHGIGLHPSYKSHDEEPLLAKEKSILEQLSGQTIDKSRAHYLRLSMPQSLERLQNIGITEDYSLGYSGQIGFRSGTSHPHQWYNIHEEIESTLRLYPLMVMDDTLKNKMKLEPDDAINEVVQMIKLCKEYKGNFTLLWHNSSLENNPEWKGWNAIFERILDCMKH